MTHFFESLWVAFETVHFSSVRVQVVVECEARADGGVVHVAPRLRVVLVQPLLKDSLLELLLQAIVLLTPLSLWLLFPLLEPFILQRNTHIHMRIERRGGSCLIHHMVSPCTWS